MSQKLMTEIHQLDASGIDKAAKLLRAGQVVAFPTETVYGLGADATNDKAVATIYEAKGRPSFNPLIVHFPNISAVNRYASLNDMAHVLADKFWPGAL
ncbi:MAG: L-threonylcarbamoyladenylate synthase, partial [Alphaproteobacteria bacterium]|nr:L-threonylcarbamoyladenylate synthase [Alphaproteobacteria bacterium]